MSGEEEIRLEKGEDFQITFSTIVELMKLLTKKDVISRDEGFAVLESTLRALEADPSATNAVEFMKRYIKGSKGL